MHVSRIVSDTPLSDLASLLDKQLFDLSEQLKVVEEFAKISKKEYLKEGTVMKNIEPPLEPFVWEIEDEEQELLDLDYDNWLDWVEAKQNN